MFVLPPPPRYPTQMMYNGTYPGGQIVPMIETNNILTNPTGPEHQFLVGEGLYVLKEDLLLATPPPHPSEAPIVNPNPLATTPQAATVGTKVSIVTIVDPPRPHALSLLLASQGSAGPGQAAPASIPRTPFSPLEEHPNESESGGSTAGGGTGASGAGADSTTGRLSINTTSAVSGASDTALVSAAASQPTAHPESATSSGGGVSAFASLSGIKSSSNKQRKPKNNMTKSNSSFISRVIVNDGLTKRLQDRPPDGLYAFTNINRAFQWLDLASEKKVDYLTKILFTKAHCLCHDVNPVTKSTAHMDVIMGFSTGEVIWWEPISQRYTRLNKNGIICGTPCSEIRWMPGSENLFMAAFMDGSLVIFDKEKEDATFVTDEDDATRRRVPEGQDPRTHIQVERSIHGKPLKTNPVTYYKLSNQRINAFAFAPDQSLLAVVSEDGSLRIIDYIREELLGLFYSYYGGLTCVCWSPDGKYVVTGGQDDLLSIWRVADATLVARCQGHHSWVTSVAFDPWRCDDRNYRFGSVGEDGRLCLWDFSVGMLIRPKAATNASAVTGAASLRQRGSIASRQFMRLRSDSGLSNGAGSAPTVADTEEDLDDESDERIHPVEPRARTAMLPPVCSTVVDKDPLCWLGFTEASIMTSSKTGHLRTWTRPTDNTA